MPAFAFNNLLQVEIADLMNRTLLVAWKIKLVLKGLSFDRNSQLLINKAGM